VNPFKARQDWPDRSGDPGLHPERPWWRSLHKMRGGVAARGRWLRTDGADVRSSDDEVLQMLAEYDLTHPLPCPPPMVGQCWVVIDNDAPAGPEQISMAVTGVVEQGGVIRNVCLTWTAGCANIERRPVWDDETVQGWTDATWFGSIPNRIRNAERPSWPPPDAVLVSGPGAPWAAPGWKP